MIRLLEKYDGSDLRDSHYSRTIFSHLKCYGTDFDFCRFYEIVAKERVGVIALFNGAAVADVLAGERLTRSLKREIAEFVSFQLPESVELPEEMMLRQGFSGYTSCSRIFYWIPPADTSNGITLPVPDDVFKTVYTDGGDYGLWLTDTLRRVNKGYSRLYCFNSSVLTVRFAIGGRAYITDVATPLEDRGKGYARRLLGGVSKILADEGIKAYLAARADSDGYYRLLGYPGFAADKIFIRKGSL